MAETITIYAGSNKAGALKKKALEKEAHRKRCSVSDLIWASLKSHGTDKLRKDLEAADAADQK